MDKKTVKELAISLGTDLVGIASADRFIGSPAVHSQTDKFPVCKSIIVLGYSFPKETLDMKCREVCPHRFGFKQ